MFKFGFTLMDDDYFEFNKYNYVHNPTGRRNLFWFRLSIPLVFLMLLGVASRDFTGTNGTPLLVSVAVAVVLSILWVVFAKTLVFRLFKNNIKKQKRRGKLLYDKEVTVAFESECFTITSRDEESKLSYSVLERIVQGEKATYLYISFNQAYVIPLRAFTNDVEIKQFIAFIQGKIAGNH